MKLVLQRAQMQAIKFAKTFEAPSFFFGKHFVFPEVVKFQSLCSFVL